MSDRACGACKWWEHYDNGRNARVGLCKRMPPTAVPFRNAHPDDDRAGRGLGYWPVMREAQWCGEFEKRD